MTLYIKTALFYLSYDWNKMDQTFMKQAESNFLLYNLSYFIVNQTKAMYGTFSYNAWDLLFLKKVIIWLSSRMNISLWFRRLFTGFHPIIFLIKQKKSFSTCTHTLSFIHWSNKQRYINDVAPLCLTWKYRKISWTSSRKSTQFSMSFHLKINSVP